MEDDLLVKSRERFIPRVVDRDHNRSRRGSRSYEEINTDITQGFFSQKDIGGLDDYDLLKSLREANRKSSTTVAPFMHVKALVETITNDAELGFRVREYFILLNHQTQ